MRAPIHILSLFLNILILNKFNLMIQLQTSFVRLNYVTDIMSCRNITTSIVDVFIYEHINPIESL